MAMPCIHDRSRAVDSRAGKLSFEPNEISTKPCLRLVESTFYSYTRSDIRVMLPTANTTHY